MLATQRAAAAGGVEAAFVSEKQCAAAATHRPEICAVCTPEEPADEPVCWICLDSASPDRPLLLQSCKCPRVTHPACMARWQLQSAGSTRETNCEFCNQRLPDWKDVLTPPGGASAPSVMNVHFDGKTYSFEVQPGREGYNKFTEAIRQAFSLPYDSELNITFTCDEPVAGEAPSSLLTLRGPGAFDAAVHCASVSAAKRRMSTGAPTAVAQPEQQSAQRITTRHLHGQAALHRRHQQQRQLSLPTYGGTSFAGAAEAVADQGQADSSSDAGNGSSNAGGAAGSAGSGTTTSSCVGDAAVAAAVGPQLSLPAGRASSSTPPAGSRFARRSSTSSVGVGALSWVSGSGSAVQAPTSPSQMDGGHLGFFLGGSSDSANVVRTITGPATETDAVNGGAVDGGTADGDGATGGAEAGSEQRGRGVKAGRWPALVRRVRASVSDLIFG